MVSAAPYQIGELVVMMVATYALWLSIVFIEAIHAHIADANLFNGVFTKLSIVGGVVVVGGAGCLVVMFFQMMPIRFGTLMFLNGMLFALLCRSIFLLGLRVRWRWRSLW